MFTNSKCTLAAAVGLMVAMSGCYSAQGPSEQGNVTFTLMVGDIDVRAVSFTVEGGDLDSPLEGRFNVHDDRDPPVWAAIMDLRPGEYTIAMRAFNAAGEVICSGTKSFTIVADAVTKVDMLLLCPLGTETEDLGHADVDATFEIIEGNVCPRLSYLGVIYDIIEPNGSSDVEVLAEDSDGDTVQATLSATSGTLSPESFSIVPPANGGLSAYTCTEAGTHTVTVTVTDGDTLCEATKSVDVVCGDDGTICTDVDCTSSNQCVADGLCDPADGSCIPGDNYDVGTACDFGGIGDGFCDGQGNCVECSSAGECAEDGNQCTTAVCEANQCGQAPLTDGSTCSFNGGIGLCEAGVCIEAPECTADADCPDDGNECTSKSCVDQSCVYSPIDGVSCDAGGVPGLCDAGACVGLCEGKDCIDGNECTVDSCDFADGMCLNVPVPDDTPCSGGTCQGGACEAGTSACLKCQLDLCQDWLGNENWVALCYDDTTPASEGPAIGVPKNDLCVAYLACAMTTPAEPGDPPCGALVNQATTVCYCGPGFELPEGDPADCQLAGAADGPCKTETENGTETTDPAIVSARQTHPDYATGRAWQLLRCIDARVPDPTTEPDLHALWPGGCAPVCYP